MGSARPVRLALCCVGTAGHSSNSQHTTPQQHTGGPDRGRVDGGAERDKDGFGSLSHSFSFVRYPGRVPRPEGATHAARQAAATDAALSSHQLSSPASQCLYLHLIATVTQSYTALGCCHVSAIQPVCPKVSFPSPPTSDDAVQLSAAVTDSSHPSVSHETLHTEKGSHWHPSLPTPGQPCAGCCRPPGGCW